MKSLLLNLLIFFALLFTVSCGGGDNNTKEITFNVIEEGYFSAYSQSGNTIDTPELIIIKNQNDFDTFWNYHTSNSIPQPTIPSINFGEEIVLVLIDHIEPSGGYSVEITTIVEYEDLVYVNAIKSIPENCISATVMTQPYQIVSIPTTPKTIELSLSVFTGCGDGGGNGDSNETSGLPTTTNEPSILLYDQYALRDTGPAGGLIFYLNPNYATDGWRYLEAAPSDQSAGVQWYNGSYVLINAWVTGGGDAIGAGQANTTAIVAVQGAGTYAAKICDDLVIGGYSDWFLPSQDELDQMYTNLQAAGVGAFADNLYWSSTDYDQHNAGVYNFSGGSSGNLDKAAGVARVRAVRAF